MNSHIDRAFWSTKRVLITGHTGFKGSWLTIWLQSMGAKIAGIALPAPTQPSLFQEANLRDDIDHYEEDIRNFPAIQNIFTKFNPDIVFHLAAQSLVRPSYVDPVDTFSTNIMGTVNVLEAARRTAGIRAFVNVTSDKCYENMEWPWGYREIEPMGGRDPYSCSKGCAELITSSYRRSFLESEGMALASVRAGNVIGGGDWSPDRLLPDILRAFEKGEPALIRNPNSIRPWQHVMEPLSGYMGLAEKLYNDKHKWSQGWNFGPNDDDARPVEEIVNYMKRNWGDGADWVKDNAEHPHEAHYLKLDVSKSKLKLGWKPKLKLETALDYVIAWHKEWLSKKDARKITLSQINTYLAHKS